MRTPLKWHALSGSLVVWLVLLIIVSGCGGGDGPPSQNEFRAAPGDELAMTAHREGKLVYEARYRWTEMPEAESGSGPEGPIPLFALLEQETHHDPNFRLVLPPKDPVTREELRTFLRDHWDEYSGGTADGGWNLEHFIRFLHRHTICWEDFFDRWEDHRAAGGTLPQLVQQITDWSSRASQGTPVGIGEDPGSAAGLPPIPIPMEPAAPATVGPLLATDKSALRKISDYYGPPRIIGPFYVPRIAFPICYPINVPPWSDLDWWTSILNRKDLLAIHYHQKPDTPRCDWPTTAVTWKAHGLRRFTVTSTFFPYMVHNCECYHLFPSPTVHPGVYVKEIRVCETGNTPFTVLKVWSGKVDQVQNIGTSEEPVAAARLTVDAGYVWLWQTFSHSFVFSIDAKKGFVEPKP
jgi:hypothetical protein